LVTLDFHILEDDPPRDFCSGAEEQDDFLHEHAWNDHQREFSKTFLAYNDGICVGYITVASEGIDMPRHAWPVGGRFGRYGASKILQMAVDRRHIKRGYGPHLLTFGVMHAIWVGQRQATRYVILDAAQGRVPWYQKQGFAILKHEQRARRKEAKRQSKNPDSIPVRMFLDLNDIPRDAELLAQIDSVFRK
jgi:GNAT superfamily N-acetyltransferase